jgi:hypothetical protein
MFSELFKRMKEAAQCGFSNLKFSRMTFPHLVDNLRAYPVFALPFLGRLTGKLNSVCPLLLLCTSVPWSKIGRYRMLAFSSLAPLLIIWRFPESCPTCK